MARGMTPFSLTTPGINKSNNVYKYTTTTAQAQATRKEASTRSAEVTLTETQQASWERCLAQKKKQNSGEKREKKTGRQRAKAAEPVGSARSFTTTFRPFRHSS